MFFGVIEMVNWIMVKIVLVKVLIEYISEFIKLNLFKIYSFELV